ncbi:helix-turn-helix transcriptional regulator [Variovorax sp. H27-G14]|uniref:helix-turn-helix domain-containing protein n=1 Tax=Variovorax sp. H27-G14 TaxID=3111914 RepID=UPI0038FC832C
MILSQLGQRVQQLRLERGLSRVALSELCGVPESTIKRFETTGEIGTKAMLRIFISLEAVDHILRLGAKSEPQTMGELMKPRRQRGRRSDAGKQKDSAA